jgi:Arc/MetJ family transcription regulator
VTLACKLTHAYEKYHLAMREVVEAYHRIKAC